MKSIAAFLVWGFCGLSLLVACFMLLAAYFVFQKDGFFAAALFALIFVGGPAKFCAVLFRKAQTYEGGSKKAAWAREDVRATSGGPLDVVWRQVTRMVRQKERTFPLLRRAFLAYASLGALLFFISRSVLVSIRGEGPFIAWLLILGLPPVAFFLRAAWRNRALLALGRKEWLVVGGGCLAFFLALRGYLPFLNAVGNPSGRVEYSGGVMNKWECGRGAGAGLYCVTIFDAREQRKLTLSVGRRDFERTPIGGQFKGEFARGRLGVPYRWMKDGKG